jgi:hypothetical protein
MGLQAMLYVWQYAKRLVVCSLLPITRYYQSAPHHIVDKNKNGHEDVPTPDFWTAIEKGVNHYINHPHKRDQDKTTHAKGAIHTLRNYCILPITLHGTACRYHSGSNRMRWAGKVFSRAGSAHNGIPTHNHTLITTASGRKIRNGR